MWKTLRKDKSVRLDEINMRSTCFIYHLGSNVLAISNWLEPCIRKLGQWYDSLAGLLVCSSLKADYNWERQKVCACVCVSTIQRCGKLIQKSKWAMLLKLRYSLKCKTGRLIYGFVSNYTFWYSCYRNMLTYATSCFLSSFSIRLRGADKVMSP